MHAVVVNVTISDETTAQARLRDQVVPQVSSAPGFVAGYWVRLQGSKGTSAVIFESEEAAQAMASGLRDQPQSGEGVTFDSVEVGEVVANA
jgi:hypothetical protein